jgi:hypothetical protein
MRSLGEFVYPAVAYLIAAEGYLVGPGADTQLRQLAGTNLACVNLRMLTSPTPTSPTSTPQYQSVEHELSQGDEPSKGE